MWPDPQFPRDLVAFIEEILNGKLHFLWGKLQVLVYLWFIANDDNNIYKRWISLVLNLETS